MGTGKGEQSEALRLVGGQSCCLQSTDWAVLEVSRGVQAVREHLLCGMVRAKTNVAALQPTVCAAWLQAWMSILYSVKCLKPLSTARSRGTLSS